MIIGGGNSRCIQRKGCLYFEKPRDVATTRGEQVVLVAVALYIIHRKFHRCPESKPINFHPDWIRYPSCRADRRRFTIADQLSFSKVSV